MDESNYTDETVGTEDVTEDRSECNKAGDIDDIKYPEKIVRREDLEQIFNELLEKIKFVSEVSNTQLDDENNSSYSLTNTVSYPLDESTSPSNNQGDFIEPRLKDLVIGQSFHDRDSMMTFLHEWSDLHFSPLSLTSNTPIGRGRRTSYITFQG